MTVGRIEFGPRVQGGYTGQGDERPPVPKTGSGVRSPSVHGLPWAKLGDHRYRDLKIWIGSSSVMIRTTVEEAGRLKHAAEYGLEFVDVEVIAAGTGDETQIARVIREKTGIGRDDGDPQRPAMYGLMSEEQ